jgi:alpha-L-fucosidase 2
MQFFQSDPLSVVEEVDKEFLAYISSSLNRLDKGFHIGDWGQIKEWKLPDSESYDVMNDTHRHLSEFIGRFPGYSLSSFMEGAHKSYHPGCGQGKTVQPG